MPASDSTDPWAKRFQSEGKGVGVLRKLEDGGQRGPNPQGSVGHALGTVR